MLRYKAERESTRKMTQEMAVMENKTSLCCIWLEMMWSQNQMEMMLNDMKQKENSVASPLFSRSR